MTEPALLLPPERRRWQRAVQALLVLVVLGASVGILVLVVQTSARLGRMTTDVATAQRRATNLSNSQRESLLLLQQITELGRGGDIEKVTERRGLLGRQLRIATEVFPPESGQHLDLTQIQDALAVYPWALLEKPAELDVHRATAMALVSQVERRVKALYGEQESYFYQATLDSLQAKRATQNALVGLVSLVALLGVCWVVLLKRRTRDDVARAYDALLGEMGERQSAEKAMRASEERFRSLVQRASDLTAVTNAAGAVGYLSPAAKTILGYHPAELAGRSLLDQIHVDDRQAAASLLADLTGTPGAAGTLELRVLTRGGQVRMLEVLCSNLLADPAVGGIVWNGRDVTDRRALQDQLSRQAYFDGLTGLPNRTLFMRRLTEALRGAKESTEPLSAVLVDLDGFKDINDSLGHAAGDELLQVVAARLSDCVRDGDTVGRLGGDEFAMVLPGPAADAISVSERILATVRRPVTLAGHDVRVGASIGIAELAGQRTAEDLLSDADIAMYAAKKGGKSRHQLFEQEMRDRTLERSRLEQQLAYAVPLGQIEVHYQPVVDLATSRVTGVEALARWRRSDGSMVQPAVFIPIAEESGLIDEIGTAVLQRACGTVQRWRQTLVGNQDLRVMVNVSGWQLLSTDYSAQVAVVLAETGLPNQALTLEVTESMLLDDSEALAGQLHRIKAMDVRLAMDDFGAGYSSLSSLLRFDVDMLKIDRMFLQVDAGAHGSLVGAVSELGHTLGMSVVAEGVETAEQLAVVRAADCDAVQGFLVSKPLPEADAALFLEWAATTEEISTLLAAGTPAPPSARVEPSA